MAMHSYGKAPTERTARMLSSAKLHCCRRRIGWTQNSN